jgi:hypothetical protein
MSRELIIFKKDTDAIGTNRGFVYQYLKTLVQWLTNYRDKVDNLIYCEVDDDLKQIDQSRNKIKWTQVKCYASVFNLKSEDIAKTIFNFFVLYVSDETSKSGFSFETNSRASRRDKLLNQWINAQPLSEKDVELLAKLVVNIQQTLRDFATETSDSLLKGIASKITTLETKRSAAAKKKDKIVIEELKAEFQITKDLAKELETKLSDVETLSDFIRRIEWVFDNVEPSESVHVLKSEAMVLLKQVIPKNASVELFFNRLLSEIFLKSTESNINDRCLDNDLLDEILSETEEQVKKYIDQEFIQKISSIELKLVDGFNGVNVQLKTIEEKINFITDKVDLSPDIPLIDLPTAEADEIEAILSKELETQSKLETKIKRINLKNLEHQELLINLATELRCRYLLFLQKLKFENLHHKRDAIKNLETLVKVHCSNTVSDNDEMDSESFDSRKFWRAFQEDLKLLLKEQKLRTKVDIDQAVVFAQMYQMAAECHLRWHNEG